MKDTIEKKFGLRPNYIRFNKSEGHIGLDKKQAD